MIRSILFLAWRNLFRNPRRTLASLATVGFGSAGLLIYQGFNTGLMNQYRVNTIHGYYGYGQLMPEGYYGKVLEKPWTVWIQDWQIVDEKLKSIPTIKETFPRISFYSFIVKGGVNLGGRGEGILPERENQFFYQLNLISGENLKAENEILLGKGLAESLNAKVGDTVTVLSQTIQGQLNGADLKVAGIFHTGIKALDDQYFRVHLKAAQNLLGTDKIELFSLDIDDQKGWQASADSILKLNLNLEPIRFEILDKVYYQNSIDFLEAQFGIIRMIVLIIVALGIVNTIAVGLLERAGEIGALRANGESRFRLFLTFIFENTIIGLIGGSLGITLALVIDKVFLQKGLPVPPGPGITRQYWVLLEMTAGHFLQALFLPTITAVLASIWPARQLLKKSIAELLRSN